MSYWQLRGHNLEQRLIHYDINGWIIILWVNKGRFEDKVLRLGEVDLQSGKFTTHRDDRVQRVSVRTKLIFWPDRGPLYKRQL